MVQLRSALANKFNAAVSAVSHATRRAKLIFGSAFALAFLVAPAAALMMSGNPSGSLNNTDAPNTDPGTAGAADTQDQSQASINDDSSVNGSGHSTSVNVNNGTTTVQVDGQTVVGPTQGPVSKTINTNDHKTTINIDRNGTTTTTTTTNNSVNSTSSVNISTNSYSSTETSP